MVNDESGNLIYEVTLSVDIDIIEAYDAWLADHIDEMLAYPGFISAEVLQPQAGQHDPDSPPVRATRVVQYRVASRADLDRYFEQHATEMREKGIKRFGTAFTATREIHAILPGGRRGKSLSLQTCTNCATPLTGQYCANCGQRDKGRVISLWQLLRDLVGDLFEVDSRVWRTLWPLVFNPGRLTTEYLRGRRVHYTPPLRLYLVTSLLFFLVVFFGARFDSDEILITNSETALQETSEAETAPAADDGQAVVDETDDENDDNGGEKKDQCLQIEVGEGQVSAYLEKRAQRACQRISAEGGGRQFVRDLVDNVPGMMFFFLPAIALLMMLLYPLSRRYYVEHLLFFVHYHSFFYVILTAAVLLSRLPEQLPGQGLIAGLFIAATTVYVPVYLFVAMRRVYRQSRLVTGLKYIALGISYLIGLAVTFAIVAAFTALSV